MFVLSASATRSGSRWYYHLTNATLKLGGKADAFVVREKYRLYFLNDSIHIPVPRWHHFARLSLISLVEDTFVVKTHHGPDETLRLLSKLNQVKITYIYRDPRDRVLSALEQGQRSREKNEVLLNSVQTLEDATKHVKASYSI